ncbi:hypothetical protein GEMRC1_009526 [Eukaryota sp. GEM-RC1]
MSYPGVSPTHPSYQEQAAPGATPVYERSSLFDSCLKCCGCCYLTCCTLCLIFVLLIVLVVVFGLEWQDGVHRQVAFEYGDQFFAVDSDDMILYHHTFPDEHGHYITEIVDIGAEYVRSEVFDGNYHCGGKDLDATQRRNVIDFINIVLPPTDAEPLSYDDHQDIFEHCELSIAKISYSGSTVTAVYCVIGNYNYRTFLARGEFSPDNIFKTMYFFEHKTLDSSNDKFDTQKLCV